MSSTFMCLVARATFLQIEKLDANETKKLMREYFLDTVELTVSIILEPAQLQNP